MNYTQSSYHLLMKQLSIQLLFRGCTNYLGEMRLVSDEVTSLTGFNACMYRALDKSGILQVWCICCCSEMLLNALGHSDTSKMKSFS